MGRPKLEDPTVPISFRMRRSASEWWTAQAQKEGITLPKLLRRICEEKADRQVSPNFKKGGRSEFTVESRDL
jgi:hypothetical protein